MAKILILGSTGMLGHVVERYFLESAHKLETVSRTGNSTHNIDVSNFDKLKSLLINNNFDFVINCIGILVHESKSNVFNAVRINSLLPLQLDIWSKEIGFRFLHISTDCVFSGIRGLYSELDITDAKDIYGKSKSLGECLKYNSTVLRTSIIGPEISDHKTGLFNWVINSSGEVDGYTNVYWNGITTLELAKVIRELCDSNSRFDGIYTISSDHIVSKYDLVSKISEIFETKLSILPVAKTYSNKSLISVRGETFSKRVSIEEQLYELKYWY